MKLLILTLVCASAWGQMWPFPGPGQRAFGGGGGSSAVFRSASFQNLDTSGSTIPTPGTLNVQAGDLVIAFVGAVNNFGVASATCGSDAMTEGPSFYDSTNNYRVVLFYKQNASANAAATVTITLTTAQTFRAIVAANYGGVATSGGILNSSCHDVGCSALSASTTNRTAQNVTTTTANAVLIAGGVDWDGGLTYTQANGFSLRASDPAKTPYLFDKSVTSTGTYPAGNFATTSAAGPYISIFAVFGLL